MIEAIEHIRDEIADVPLDSFEADWRKLWLIERGVEIIPGASRRLPADLKARHPESYAQTAAATQSGGVSPLTVRAMKQQWTPAATPSRSSNWLGRSA
jgi:hypothetical protein